MSRLALDLHELAAEHEQDVAVDPARAWVAGRRRRLRVGAGTVGAAGAVLGGLVLGLVGLPGPGADSSVGPAGAPGSTVDGHPARVDKPWFVDDLDGAPGPQAGVLTAGGRDYVVDAGGSVRRLPPRPLSSTTPPILSDDGVRLAYVDDDGFVVRDLVTGDRVDYPQIVVPAALAFGGEKLDSSSIGLSGGPTFFSPDGVLLFVPGTSYEHRDDGLLLGGDGSVKTLEVRASGSWFAAGWADSDTLVWYGHQPRGSKKVEVVETDLNGVVTDRRMLQGEEVLVVDAWSAVVSPDRQQLALYTDRKAGADLRVTEVFTLRNGRVRGGVVGTPVDDECRLSWASRPAWSVTRDGHPRLQDELTALVAISPRWDASCSTWAGDALSGPRHRGLFGGWSSAWTWQWRELLIVLGLMGGGTAVVVLRRRRRRLAAPVSAGPAPGSG